MKKGFWEKIRFLRFFSEFEKSYNAATVLAFTYANAWYEFAPQTTSQIIQSRDDMRDMRATATDQIVAYLFGRDYMSQEKIKDKSVRERSVFTRSYVPMWADEIMNRDPSFKDLVVQSLICAGYFEQLQKIRKREFVDNVDIGTAQRREQMVSKYIKSEEVDVDLEYYRSLIEQFSEWDDKYAKLTEMEKISLAEDNALFLQKQ